jgi:hypothetical protein
VRTSLVAVVASIVVATACGSLKAAAPSGDLLVASSKDAVAVLDASGKVVSDLPGAHASAAAREAFAVDIDAAGNTTVRLLDVASGATVRSIAAAGRWSAVGEYRGPSGFSANGAWLALRASDDSGRFLIVDTSGRTAPKIVAAGRSYEFDALSDDAKSLYLVEHLVGTSYRVRVLDVPLGILIAGAIVDVKQAATTADANGVMTGRYTTSVAAPSADWYFSVYEHPANGPYIHALNTKSRIAECILDLPTFGNVSRVESAKHPYWSLAVAARQGFATVFAINAAIGQVALIDGYEVKVKKTRALGTPPASGTAPSFAPINGAVVSPDGYRLYAVGETGIAVVDTQDLGLRSTFMRQDAFRSLAVSSDSSTLYALAGDGLTVVALDARTGKPATSLTLPARAESIAVLKR